jgi:thioredoxin reductase (NADPH)
MERPVFLLVSGDESRRDGLGRDLRRRFGADYRVAAVDSAAAAGRLLCELAAAGAEVALVIADEHLAGEPAVDLLARAHELHRGAKRILLIDRGNWSAVPAMAVGKIDCYLYVPWEPLERILYPAVSEILAAWDQSRDPGFVAFRIVGPAHSPAAHRIRDDLSRIGVPYAFADQASGPGRQLLREHGLAGTSDPVLITRDGSPYVNPSHAELLAMLGLRPAADQDACDVAIIGAGPTGLAAAVYAASEGLRAGRDQHADP